MNKGGGGAALGGGGGGLGGGSGPTAAAAAAAAQKQKALLQRVDTDITNIVDNFSHLVNVSRVNELPVRNSQEAFMMEMRAARMVADSLEKGTEHEDEYMISEKELLVNRFISIPKDMGTFNCGAFVAANCGTFRATRKI